MIDPGLSRQALRVRVGEPLGMDEVEAAAGVLEILTDTMMRAVRLVTIERGYDPRDFVLCGFGGSGPMYAVDIARGLAVPRVVVPRHPGVFSAYGLLRSDVVYDATRSILREIARDEASDVEAQLQALEALVLAQFERDGFAREDVHFRRIGELLYSEQMHELPIDLGDPPFTEGSLEQALEAFHAEHLRTYGHNEPHDPVSFVNLKVLGEKPHVTPAPPAAPIGDERGAGTETREVYFSATGWTRTEVVPRPSLAVGRTVEGPMLLTQVDTTVVLPPGSSAEVLATGDLMVAVGQG
jgi:N-methylhydantoinase A